MAEGEYSRRKWIAQVLSTAAATSLLADDTSWQPTFLTKLQDQTLSALGEAIIPGSSSAHCNRVIDLLLTLESKSTQGQMTAALQAFDNRAHERHGVAFSKLTPDQQSSVLSEADKSEAPLSSSFKVIKEWMADTYWTSQQGLRELGWTGRMAWSSFDGCPHPAKHS
jgi:hypothetical protein